MKLAGTQNLRSCLQNYCSLSDIGAIVRDFFLSDGIVKRRSRFESVAAVCIIRPDKGMQSESLARILHTWTLNRVSRAVYKWHCSFTILCFRSVGVG